MNPIIQVTVDLEGNVEVRAVGFTGSACRAATQALERAVGITASETLTPEFFRNEVVDQPIRLSNES